MTADKRAALPIAAKALAVSIALGAAPQSIAAVPETGPVQTAIAAGVSVVSIRDHRGGFLPMVVSNVDALNRAGVAGRIDGAFCFSACTVYLALRDVCVAPHTQFGFHAPKDPRSGRVLTGAAFERATMHVADYYRPALAAWWLRHGRHVQSGMAFRTGADLIAMGYRACPPARSQRSG